MAASRYCNSRRSSSSTLVMSISLEGPLSEHSAFCADSPVGSSFQTNTSTCQYSMTQMGEGKEPRQLDRGTAEKRIFGEFGRIAETV